MPANWSFTPHTALFQASAGMETRSGVHAFLVARGPIWFGVPYRDALKFTFAQLPGNNGVDVGVVHNDESRSAPADRTSWQELQHSWYGRSFAPDGGKTLPS
jgi:hypothetical protein